MYKIQRLDTQKFTKTVKLHNGSSHAVAAAQVYVKPLSGVV